MRSNFLFHSGLQNQKGKNAFLATDYGSVHTVCLSCCTYSTLLSVIFTHPWSTNPSFPQTNPEVCMGYAKFYTWKLKNKVLVSRYLYSEESKGCWCLYYYNYVSPPPSENNVFMSYAVKPFPRSSHTTKNVVAAILITIINKDQLWMISQSTFLFVGCHCKAASWKDFTNTPRISSSVYT